MGLGAACFVTETAIVAVFEMLAFTSIAHRSLIGLSEVAYSRGKTCLWVIYDKLTPFLRCCTLREGLQRIPR
jgi:hypothetical protein